VHARSFQHGLCAPVSSGMRSGAGTHRIWMLMMHLLSRASAHQSSGMRLVKLVHDEETHGVSIGRDGPEQTVSYYSSAVPFALMSDDRGRTYARVRHVPPSPQELPRTAPARCAGSACDGNRRQLAGHVFVGGFSGVLAGLGGGGGGFSCFQSVRTVSVRPGPNTASFSRPSVQTPVAPRRPYRIGTASASQSMVFFRLWPSTMHQQVSGVTQYQRTTNSDV
jgi:hypothetical protein